MLGPLLLSWREAAHMTQTHAQQRLGYKSTGTISLHETGQSQPSAVMVRRYAGLYGRPESDLVAALLLLAGVDAIGGTDPPNTPEIVACGDSAAP